MSFNFNDVEITNQPVPDGDISAIIEKAEWKQSKAGAEYLNVMFQVAEGNHKGKTIFHMYNLMNQSEQARNIALQDMKKLLTAIDVDMAGAMSKEDLVAKIFGKLVVIKVGNKTDDYGAKNTIKGYKKATISNDIGF